MNIFPLALITALLITGCSSISKSSDAGLLVIDPFTIELEQGETVEIFSFTGDDAGANVLIGKDTDSGFLLSKNTLTSLFHGGPERLGIGVDVFLSRLADAGISSADLTIYRQALGISVGTRTRLLHVDDWLFLVIDADTSPVAYGVNPASQMGFEIFHGNGFESLLMFVSALKIRVS